MPGHGSRPRACCLIRGDSTGIIGSSATTRCRIRPPRRMVEACISAYSQTVAMCPGAHWRTNENGGRERVTSSALYRILKRPNTYQSISDFMLNAVRELYSEGNAYALALRNDRFEINELHLMRSRECHARIAETGDVFYTLAGNADH